MKKILILFLFTILISCSDENELIRQTKVIDPKSVDSKKSSGARTPDGSGSGSPTSPGDNGLTSGFALTWNGDGRWHGNFAGSPVWFWGPTPTQLQNGIQGTWEVTCAYYTPGVCYPDGFTVWGNGAGFTVGAPACSSVGSSTITMPKLTAKYIDKGIGHTPIIQQITWSTETRTVTTLSGGKCVLFAEAKVIVNEQLFPQHQHT